MSLNTSVLMTNATFSEFQDTVPKKVIKVMMYCILLVVSFTGNLLIVWATSRDIRLRSTTNILIANMAVSDLLVPFFSMPRRILYVIFFNNIWFIHGDFGLALCKLAYYLPDVSLSVSVYSCVFIALDRFYAVIYPFRGGFSRTKLKCIIPGIWMFSMAMFSVHLFTFTLVKTGDSIKCLPDFTTIGVTTALHYRIFYSAIFTLNVGIPLPVVSFLYFRIALTLRRTVISKQAGNASSVRKRQNRNALKLSAVIVSLFFLSWLPLTVYLFLRLFGNLDSLSLAARNDFNFSAIFIIESSCCYNFFIYLAFTKVYRQNFTMLFSRCTRRANPSSSCSRRFGTNSFALESISRLQRESEVNLNTINEPD